MTTIESKLNELENLEYELTELVPDESATVNGGSANGVILMYANEVNSVLEQYGALEAKLIAALREAVVGLGGYATLPKGVYAGPDDLYPNLGDSAEVTLTSIEKILGDKK